jgi:hypothetical protein
MWKENPMKTGTGKTKNKILHGNAWIAPCVQSKRRGSTGLVISGVLCGSLGQQADGDC